MDLVLKRPWVGVLVFFCIAMVPTESGDSCLATVKIDPETLMRMAQGTMINGNILKNMVEKAMKCGDKNKMIKGIKGLTIIDLSIPSTSIDLQPHEKMCVRVTVNITVAGKSMLPKIVNKFLDSTLGKVMPGVLCPAADMMMEKEMEAFEIMLAKKPLGNVGYIVYEVAEKPVVYTTYISIQIKIVVQKKNGDIIESECDPLPENLPPKEDKMSAVYLSSSALNAVMALIQTHLNTPLTKVKGSVPTSDHLKKILPKAGLPAGKKLKIQITHTENPTVSVSPSASFITTYTEASFLDAKRGNKILSIKMKHQCSVSFAIKEEHLGISLKAGSCRAMEVSSPAGDVTGAMEYTETVMESWIPHCAGVLNKHQVPLPTLMNITNTPTDAELRFEQDLLIIEANIEPYSAAQMEQEVRKQCKSIKL